MKQNTLGRDALLFILMVALTVSGVVQGRTTAYVVIMGIFAVLMGVLTVVQFVKERKKKSSKNHWDAY
jgi:uncharacterized membrane protein HdeD (DUF308 family)